MSGYAGQHVVELGSGASPLLALACLRHCRSYTGTDGSKRALALLAKNLAANSRSVRGPSPLSWPAVGKCPFLEHAKGGPLPVPVVAAR